MTDTMPETIWAQCALQSDTWFSSDEYPRMITDGHTSYTRTDIHEAVIAERDALKVALEGMRGRYRLYSGWPNLSFAGHNDVKILEEADATLGESDTAAKALAALNEPRALNAEGRAAFDAFVANVQSGTLPPLGGAVCECGMSGPCMSGDCKSILAGGR